MDIVNELATDSQPKSSPSSTQLRRVWIFRRRCCRPFSVPLSGPRLTIPVAAFRSSTRQPPRSVCMSRGRGRPLSFTPVTCCGSCYIQGLDVLRTAASDVTRCPGPSALMRVSAAQERFPALPGGFISFRSWKYLGVLILSLFPQRLTTVASKEPTPTSKAQSSHRLWTSPRILLLRLRQSGTGSRLRAGFTRSSQ